jgi:hypothetical protein
MSEPAFGTIKQVSRHLCILAYVGVCALALLAQSDTGELRLKVTDQAGLPIPSSVELVSQANQVRQKLEAAVDGTLVVKRLPFGVYRLRVERPGFAPLSELVEIRSSLPRELRVTLGVAPIETVVTVNESETLVDPHRSGTVNRIGSETLQDRITAQPGRSLLDLVDTQPGWLLEANGVLHPRGSEYQTQYVVDGIPLTENRSPAFAPELEADDVQSMSVLTARVSWQGRPERRQLRYSGRRSLCAIRVGPEYPERQWGRGPHRPLSRSAGGGKLHQRGDECCLRRTLRTRPVGS